MRPHKILLTLVCLMAVTGIVVSPVAANDTLEEADDVYLEEDGAIVVYDEELDEDINHLELGADVSTGIVYGLLEFEDETIEDTDGHFGIELDQDSISVDSALTATETAGVPAGIEGELSGTLTEDELGADIVASGPVDPAEVGLTQGSVSTSGELEVAADSLAVTDMTLAAGTVTETETAIDLTISETDTGYVGTADIELSVPPEEADQWDSPAAVEQTVTDLVAQQLPPEAEVDVEVEDHEFVDGTVTATVTVDVSGVETIIAEQVVTQLVQGTTITPGDAAYDELVTAFEQMELDTLELMIELGADEAIDAAFSLQLNNYDTFVEEYAELMGTEEPMIDEDDVAAALDQLAAADEADFVQTINWEFSVDEEFLLEVGYETDNWDAYLEEIEEELDAEGELTATLETTEEEIDVALEGTVEREGLLGDAVDAITSEIQGGTGDSVPEELGFLEGFDEAELTVAKTDILMNEGTVEIEAGASFEDFGALEQELLGGTTGVTMEHIYAEQQSPVQTYMYVDADEDEDIENELEEAGIVGPDTTVHGVGEWDEEFPRLDTDQAGEYLDVDVTVETTADDDDGLMGELDALPGFGISAALTAVLIALLALRLRGNR